MTNDTANTLHLVGHCQVCDREIGATLGRIAHHGYTRPSDGWQTSSCPGALHAPLEVAYDALDKHIIDLAENVSSLQATVRFHEAQRRPIPNREAEAWLLSGQRGPMPPAFIEEGSPRYERHRDGYLASLQRAIDATERELARQQLRRAGWEPQDLATVSLELAKEEAAEREARKNARDAKRAARQAKADALLAKRTAFYAQPCEFAVARDGRRHYCFTHGMKALASHHRDDPRIVSGERCEEVRYFERRRK